MKQTLFLVRRRLTLLLIVSVNLLLLATGCSRLSLKEPKPQWFKRYAFYDNREYEAYFRQRITAMPDDTLPDWAWVLSCYRDKGKPEWTEHGFQTHRIDTLLGSLAAAYEHGLPPLFFNDSSLTAQIGALKSYAPKDANTLYAALFRLEMSLTEAYVRYAAVLQYGATRPEVANGGKWLYETERPDSLFVMSLFGNINRLPVFLKELQPTDTSYLLLQEELRALYPFKDTVLKPIPRVSIALNQRNAAVKTICGRLQITGELPDDCVTDVLTEEVMAAVNLFRENNALPQSDTLDSETIDCLNRPISYYVEKVAVNLERLRWKTVAPKPDTYIAVNVPDFRLRAYRDGECVINTRVCCGKGKNPSGDPERMRNGLVQAFKSETPLLYGEISSVVLNPEWNIPYNIVRDEYYPKLCRDNVQVIQRERLLVRDTRNGKLVAPETIDWTNVNPKNIPYRLFQQSGKFNALGRIKFDFQNGESVYLHDTNNKGAFKRRVRAVSHGCVRVENPFELAALLYELNGFDSLKREQLDILVGKEPTTEEGEAYAENIRKRDSVRYARLSEQDKRFYRRLLPTRIKLTCKMPLFIEYMTCFSGENGYVQYRKDVYCKDGNILKLLASRSTTPQRKRK